MTVAWVLISLTTALYAQGFESVARLTPFSVSKNSGENTQSKVWKHDGKWWTVFPVSSGTYIWKLNGSTWSAVSKLSSNSNTKADCKVVGNVCHILLWREYGYSSMLVSVQYDAGLKNYKPWSQRSSTINLTLDAGVEAATIDIDGTGRMWLASDGGNDIRVRWSDSPYNTWSQPIIIASSINSDDIGTVVALPALGKIGVFWSNQNTKRFGFKTHEDGAHPTTWSADEVPGSQSALNIRSGMADDHMDLAVSSNGTLYATFKTGYDTNGYPQIALLKRNTNGAWDNVYEVADKGTKPIVIINETQAKLKVVFPLVSGGNILYRESPLHNISFGPLQTLMSGAFDGPSSAKDNYNSDIVIVATDINTRQIAGVLASDATAAAEVPDAPVLVAPQNLSTDEGTSVSLRWNPSEFASSYRAQVSLRSDFATLYLDRSNLTMNALQLDNLSEGTKYYWRVQASNSQGVSNWSATWNFTVNSSPTEFDITAYWNLDEGSGKILNDGSANGNIGQTIGSPGWISGISGSALSFNGSNQYVTVPDHASLDISGQITLAAWIRPQQVSSQKIIIKGDSKIADGYELGLLSTGKVSFRINEYSSDSYKVNSNILYPTNGTWMHVAASFNGTQMKLYINGSRNKTVTFSSPVSIGRNNLALTLGASVDETSFFSGAIDEIRVYGRALSDSEIYELATTSAQKTNATARLSVPDVATIDTVQTAEEYPVVLYPNPADNELFIELPPGAPHAVSITDAYGHVLYRSTTTGQEHTLTIPLDDGNFRKGLHLLSVQSQTSTIVRKFIKR